MTLNNDSQLLTINHEYSDKAIFAKNYFRIGKNVSITIIENINSKNKSYNNLLNFFDLDEGSNVNHYVLHNSNEDSLSKVKCQNNYYLSLFFLLQDRCTHNAIAPPPIFLSCPIVSPFLLETHVSPMPI